MKIKFVLTVIFLFALTEIGLSQKHSSNYLGVPKQKILSAFGKPNAVTHYKGLEQLQYISNNNFDSDKATSTTFEIKYGRCVTIFTFWNYSTKQKARKTFEYLARQFRPHLSVLKDDDLEKIFCNANIVITLTYSHMDNYMVVSRLDERQ